MRQYADRMSRSRLEAAIPAVVTGGVLLTLTVIAREITGSLSAGRVRADDLHDDVGTLFGHEIARSAETMHRMTGPAAVTITVICVLWAVAAFRRH